MPCGATGEVSGGKLGGALHLRTHAVRGCCVRRAASMGGWVRARAARLPVGVAGGGREEEKRGGREERRKRREEEEERRRKRGEVSPEKPAAGEL